MLVKGPECGKLKKKIVPLECAIGAALDFPVLNNVDFTLPSVHGHY